MDRRQALAQGRRLPERTSGAALFADISGFSPLTEALVQALGSRRGAEELTRQLNLVYDALVAEVDRYGGSVIGFSGDAITCWFDDEAQGIEAPEPAGVRAAACALAMQQAMQHPAHVAVTLPGAGTAELMVKVAVASGPAGRFVVGDPNIQLIDITAGDTLARMATAEHLANKGEVVIDAQTAAQLGRRAQIVAWRAPAVDKPNQETEETDQRFAVLGGLQTPVEPSPWPPLAADALGEAQVRPWLLPAVYERLREGLGEFLMELRPVVALFLRFSGIDYDRDEAAGAKLDAYIRWVQKVLTNYEGALVQLTIGDKGSYLYAVLGAPLAHEDDACRAVSAALELRSPPPELDFISPAQIGISQGTMRTGAYGGKTRRTYGVLGDEVNLAARLMQHTAPGQVLVSRRIQKATAATFAWETLPAIQVKGKAEPVPVARLLGRSIQPAAEAARPYTGDLVGREAELAQLMGFVQPILEDRFAGLIYVYGETGVGKSRLVYELRQRLTRPLPASLPKNQSRENAGERVRWFTCPGEAILRQSLYPFRHWLHEYLEQRPDSPVDENKTRFDQSLNALLAGLPARPGASDIAHELERTRSMLGALVDLHWEGSLYEQLEPQLRFENTLAAFKMLIQAESLRQPVILHIEDAHWLDADSQELIKTLVHGAGAYPFAVLLTGRYRDDGSRFSLEVEADVPQQAIDLDELGPSGIRTMAAQILGGEISDELATFLAEKTSGNPFFIEQLALDLRERGALRAACGTWEVEQKELTEVPASVNAVLVARLDRLVAQVKAVVQTAAVLGQEFEVRVLSQMLKGDELLPTRIKQAEAEAIWLALSEMRYIFKHALLRDAAYDMQLWARLRELHALAGATIEQVYAADLAPHYADLAYHYSKAEDARRECHYAGLAGEQAAARFANAEAVRYLSRALELLEQMDLEPAQARAQRYGLLLGREGVYGLMGQRDAQVADLVSLQTLADEMNDNHRRATAALRHAAYREATSDFTAALMAAQVAVNWAEQAGDVHQKIEGLVAWARALWRQGRFEDARPRLEEALALARQHGDRAGEATSLHNLGTVSYFVGDYRGARDYLEQARQIRHSLGDRRGEAISLGNLVGVYDGLGDLAKGKICSEQALAIYQAIGDRQNEAQAMSNLGNIYHALGEMTIASDYHRRALALFQAIGDRRGEALAAENLGLVLHALGDNPNAQSYCEQALKIDQAIGDREGEGYGLTYLGLVLEGMGELERAAAAHEQALELRREIGQAACAIDNLAGLARVALAQKRPERALACAEETLDWIASHGLDGIEDPVRVYLTCADVLAMAGQPGRVAEILLAAQAWLRERAARISDEVTRQTFEWVPLHRQLHERLARCGLAN